MKRLLSLISLFMFSGCFVGIGISDRYVTVPGATDEEDTIPRTDLEKIIDKEKTHSLPAIEQIKEFPCTK